MVRMDFAAVIMLLFLRDGTSIENTCTPA